jgi:hypothetical protein
LVLLAEPADFLVGSGQVAVAWESLLTLPLQDGLPVAELLVADAEAAGRLGDGASLLGDQLHGCELELAGVLASRLVHFRTSQE